MTVVIEVKPELAQRWREIAEREGRTIEAIAAQAAEAGTPVIDAQVRASRQLTGFGKFAGLGVTVESHHAFKREEIKLDEANCARRGGAGAGKAEKHGIE